MKRREHILYILLISCIVLLQFSVNAEDNSAGKAHAGTPFEIRNIRIAPKSFNPAIRETVKLYFSVSGSGKALVQIFDPDRQLVKELRVKDIPESGLCCLQWDGTDIDGKVVPDEAYFFTINAYAYTGEMAVYDPTVFSGGENISFPVEFDPDKNVVNYTLPEDTRTIIRAGVKKGPMIKCLVNWRPRTAGHNLEFLDASDVVKSLGENELTIIAEGLTLPENSIFTSGNRKYNYFTYKNEWAEDRPFKQERKRKSSPGYSPPLLRFVQPAHKGVDIEFRLELPQKRSFYAR